jgi:cytochrome c556
MRCVVGLLLLGLVVWTARVDAQAEKAPDIKEIMGKLNKPTGVYFSMARELKEDTPEWDEVKTQAKILAQQAAALTKTTPPRGEKSSWDVLVKAYADNAQKAQKAVERMDKAGAQASMALMGGMACNKCHEAHRKK